MNLYEIKSIAVYFEPAAMQNEKTSFFTVVYQLDNYKMFKLTVRENQECKRLILSSIPTHVKMERLIYDGLSDTEPLSLVTNLEFCTLTKHYRV